MFDAFRDNWEFSVKEFSKFSKVSVAQLNKLIASNKLKALKNEGKIMRIRMAHVRVFINACSFSHQAAVSKIIKNCYFRELGARIDALKDKGKDFEAFYDAVLDEAVNYFDEMIKSVKESEENGMGTLPSPDSVNNDFMLNAYMKAAHVDPGPDISCSGLKAAAERAYNACVDAWRYKVAQSSLERESDQVISDSLHYYGGRLIEYVVKKYNVDFISDEISDDDSKIYFSEPYEHARKSLNDLIDAPYKGAYAELKRALEEVAFIADSILKIMNSESEQLKALKNQTEKARDNKPGKRADKEAVLLIVGYHFLDLMYKKLYSEFNPKGFYYTDENILLLKYLDNYKKDRELGTLAALVIEKLILAIKSSEEKQPCCSIEIIPNKDKSGRIIRVIRNPEQA